MFPATRLPKYTDLLEFKPVPPDVHAQRPTLYLAGRDEILEAGVAEAFRLIGRRQGPIGPGMTLRSWIVRDCGVIIGR